MSTIALTLGIATTALVGVPLVVLLGLMGNTVAATGAMALGMETRQSGTVDAGIRLMGDTTQWYKAAVWLSKPLEWIGPDRTFAHTLSASTAVASRLNTSMQRSIPIVNKVMGAAGFQTATQKDPRLSHSALLSALVGQMPAFHALLTLFMPTIEQSNRLVQSSTFPSWLVNRDQWRSFQHNTALFTGDVKNLNTLLPIVSAMVPGHGTARYFLIYENTGELRSTGGFMTAYSYVTFVNGHLQALHSHNIYNLQPQIRYRPVAPLIIHTYLYSPLWHLRDANTSPNVPTSVKQIYKFYDSIHNAPPLNGVIFVNTWLADAIIKDIGGVTMPKSYNNLHLTSSNANYEMEYMAERSPLPSALRKKFIAIMFHDVLHKLAHSPVPVMLTTLDSVFASLQQKNIIFYFNNPHTEKLAQAQNWAGTVDGKVTGDYLEVVDENLGGHKDNFYMHYTVTSNIQQVGDRYRQTTTVKWTNTGIYDDWLVVPYTSWVRFYVPYGSQLISLTGGNAITQDYRNGTLHKTVFGNHLTMPVRLNSGESPTTATMTAEYWLPKGINLSQYVIQKQPGIRQDREYVNFDGHALPPFTITADRTVPLP